MSSAEDPAALTLRIAGNAEKEVNRGWRKYLSSVAASSVQRLDEVYTGQATT
jgi:hypothetical protein